MSNMNKTENVILQYTDDKNLSVRTDLHTKYSVNKQGLKNWLFEQYKFEDNFRILELGCGNGLQWEGEIDKLPQGAELVLSDLSEGMLKTAAERYRNFEHVKFMKIDIQNIPFEDKQFDAVIANHMLYHVPDLSKALSEVKRVLKDGGTFYCTTNGNGGMRTFLKEVMAQAGLDASLFTKPFSFSLQNGKEVLESFFSEVQRIDYEDALSVTETKDIIHWMKSAASISSYTEADIDGLFDVFESIRASEGSIDIPKECGLFISFK